MPKSCSLDDPKLAALLMELGVGVLPSDTVYGLACTALDPAAVRRLYQIKHREKKPGTLIAASVEQLVELGLDQKELEQASQYWPGPTSVLIQAPSKLLHLTQQKPELACRVVGGPSALLDLLQKVGPLLTTSANDPGMPTAETIAQAQAYFGDELDFYVDGGDMSGNLPSTLIRIKENDVEILRQGAGTIHAQEEIT